LRIASVFPKKTLFSTISFFICVSCKQTLENNEAIVASSSSKGDWLGVAIDISDSFFIASAFKADGVANNSGTVYQFTENGNTWSDTNEIFTNFGKSGDEFGYSVSTHFNSFAVSATRADSKDGANEAGAVYLYSLRNGIWTEDAVIESPRPHDSDMFGYSLSLNNNLLAVGAKLDDTVQENSGAVYLYRKMINNDGWELSLSLYAPDAEDGSRFGTDVVLTDKWLAVGAPETESTQAKTGSVFIYNRNEVENGNIRPTEIRAKNLFDGDKFGTSIDIYDKFMVVGASNWSAENRTGRAFIFENIDDAWTQSIELTPNDINNGDMFGFQVAITDGIAVVGSHLQDTNDIKDSGAVYVFTQQCDNIWSHVDTLYPTYTNKKDWFGISLALKDKTLLVGSERADIKGRDSGAIYYYDVSFYKNTTNLEC